MLKIFNLIYRLALGIKPYARFVFFAWLLIILGYTIVPNPEGSEGIRLDKGIIRLDYLIHFVSFCFLSLLYCLWFANVKLKINISYLIYAIAPSIILAFILEYVQQYVEGRSYNEIDFLFNGLGALSGLFIYFFFSRSLEKRA